MLGVKGLSETDLLTIESGSVSVEFVQDLIGPELEEELETLPSREQIDDLPHQIPNSI
jgi:hypothetical protein